ncbi:peptidase [Photobacterium aquae]|uniref:Peptidase n=1 Tax=Photobacterium aquae TaxID=1195763 RepID=A0A0J1H372_9GAMM|nr:prepilin-type N-terminal cleavage/methylation domain-containing protein [Photobacterium aquae]KLV06233.1 peptidase [Photobacterium aquae]
MKLKGQKGFTLIELMIVVAIIGIISAFAIPAYSDYTQRTRVAGAVTGITGFKTAIALCAQDLGTLTGCNAGTNQIPAAVAAGDAGATISYVDSVGITNGVITVSSTGVQDDGTTNLNVVLTPTIANGVVQWDLTGNGCTVDGRSIDCSGS